MRSLSEKSPRSVAGQVFILQVAVVVLLVACGMLALVLQSRHDSEREAVNRSVAAARTFARSPGLPETLKGPDPSKVLQPVTELARKEAGVDFIVVMDTHGTRYTHPIPARIGQRFVGTIEPSLHGKVYTESVQGPLGHEVQAVVPVHDPVDDPHGAIIALVSVSMKVTNVTVVVNRQLPIVLGAGAAALALAMAGTALISKRLRRQTPHLDPVAMSRRRADRRTLGHPLHPRRQGAVGRATAARGEHRGGGRGVGRHPRRGLPLTRSCRRVPLPG